MAATKPLTEAQSPREIIAAADAEIAEADALSASLEAAARSGDPSVSMEDVDDAKKRSQWARIRRDAAEKRAVDRAAEIQRDDYSTLIETNVPIVEEDNSAVIAALLDQARPLLEEAMNLVGRRNRALWALASYAADRSNFSEVGDGLVGEATTVLPGASWFEFRGVRHEYISGTSVMRDLLRPLTPRAQVLSGGMDDDFLRSI